MTKAFGYMRVSGTSQIEGDGPERQERAIRTFAFQQGIQIEQLFFDGGVSGKREFEDRPQWVEMLKAIAANGVRTIIVEKLDRMARDLMVQEHILEDLKKREVKLISAAEPDLCADDPSRKLIRQVLGAIHEYDRAMIVVRMRSAKIRMRERGEKTDGAYAFGHHPEKPQETPVMRWIIESYANGAGFREIAKALNRKVAEGVEGAKPRRAATWTPTSVFRVLDKNRALARHYLPPETVDRIRKDIKRKQKYHNSR